MSLPNNKILNKITIFYSFSSNSTGPVSIYIILSLYNIRSPEIVTNGKGLSFSLYSIPNLLTANGNMWFFVTLLSTNALNFLSRHLALKFKYYPMTPLRV